MRIQKTPVGRHPFKRSVAIVTVVIFLSTELFHCTPSAFAQPAHSRKEVTGGTPSEHLLRLAREPEIRIPPELGIIEENIQVTGDRSRVEGETKSDAPSKRLQVSGDRFQVTKKSMIDNAELTVNVALSNTQSPVANLQSSDTRFFDTRHPTPDTQSFDTQNLLLDTSHPSFRIPHHPRSKTIIYIQDAHDSLEAQENIAKIIDHLVTNYGVKTVFEEGYEGPVPTDKYFGAIKDPVIKEKVSYFLMDHLRLGGAEYAHINRRSRLDHRQQTTDQSKNQITVDGSDETKKLVKEVSGDRSRVSEKNNIHQLAIAPRFTIHNPQFTSPGSWYLTPDTRHPATDFTLIGADSIKLHRKNIAQYRKSAKRKKSITEDLEVLEKEIKGLANRYFPKELKEWIRQKELFDGGQLPLLDYLKRTAKVLDKTSHYPNIQLVIDAEKSTDQTVLEKIKSINAKDLFVEMERLEDDIAEKYLQSEQSAAIEKVPPPLMLPFSAHEAALRHRSSAPPWRTHSHFRPRFRTLELGLQSVPQSTSRALNTNLSPNSDHQKIFDYYRSIRLLKRLNNLRLSFPEYQAVKDSLRQLDTEQMAQFIGRETKKTLILSRRWEKNIREAVEFYEIAQERDEVIAGQMKNFLNNPNEQTAILVFGGFHRNNIKEILKQLGISCVVVSPKITQPSPKHEAYYKRLMTVGRHSYEVPNILAHATRPESRIEIWAANPLSLAKKELRLMASAAARVSDENPSRTMEASLRDFAKHSNARPESRTDRSVSHINAEYIQAHEQAVLLRGGRYDAVVQQVLAYLKMRSESSNSKESAQSITIADFGAGPGSIIENIAMAAGETFPGIKMDITAFEYDPLMLDILKGRESIHHVVASDLTKDDFLAYQNKFDIVLLMQVLHEVFSFSTPFDQPIDLKRAKLMIREVLRKVINTLKPGGLIMISDPLEPPENPDQWIRIRFHSNHALEEFYKFQREYVPIQITSRIPGKDPLTLEMPLRHFWCYFILVGRPNEDGSGRYFDDPKRWEIERHERHAYFSENEFLNVLAEGGVQAFVKINPATKAQEQRLANRIELPSNLTLPYDYALISGAKPSPLPATKGSPLYDESNQPVPAVPGTISGMTYETAKSYAAALSEAYGRFPRVSQDNEYAQAVLDLFSEQPAPASKRLGQEVTDWAETVRDRFPEMPPIKFLRARSPVDLVFSPNNEAVVITYDPSSAWRADIGKTSLMLALHSLGFRVGSEDVTFLFDIGEFKFAASAYIRNPDSPSIAPGIFERKEVPVNVRFGTGVIAREIRLDRNVRASEKLIKIEEVSSGHPNHSPLLVKHRCKTPEDYQELARKLLPYLSEQTAPDTAAVPAETGLENRRIEPVPEIQSNNFRNATATTENRTEMRPQGTPMIPDGKVIKQFRPDIDEIRQRDPFRAVYLAMLNSFSWGHYGSLGQKFFDGALMFLNLSVATFSMLHGAHLDSANDELAHVIKWYHQMRSRVVRLWQMRWTDPRSAQIEIKAYIEKNHRSFESIVQSLVTGPDAQSLDDILERFSELQRTDHRKTLDRVRQQIVFLRDFWKDRNAFVTGKNLDENVSASFAEVKSRLIDVYKSTKGQLVIEADTAAENARVGMSYVRFFMLLSHLVGNAMGPVLETRQDTTVIVHLTIDPATQELIIRVTDNAPSIEDHYFQDSEDGLPNLFTIEKEGKKVHIGLWDALDIVGLSGGSIEVMSCAQEGNKFEIHLPLAKSRPETRRAQNEEPAALTEQSPIRSHINTDAEIVSKITPAVLQAMKVRGEKIVMTTGYNQADTELLERAGIEVILVGDSYGMVRLGFPDTTHVTMEHMVEAVSQASQGISKALLVGDMPYQSYENPVQAVENAQRLIQAGAAVIKLEGGQEVAAIVKAIVEKGIPVMGHIAYTPQTVQDHKIKGRGPQEAKQLLDDAFALEEAGVFAIVIELADRDVSREISRRLRVPTIGIGAGPDTDGQVLVLDDLLGRTNFGNKVRYPAGQPKMIGQWDRSAGELPVLQNYRQKVKAVEFPDAVSSFSRYQGPDLAEVFGQPAQTHPDRPETRRPNYPEHQPIVSVSADEDIFAIQLNKILLGSARATIPEAIAFWIRYHCDFAIGYGAYWDTSVFKTMTLRRGMSFNLSNLFVTGMRKLGLEAEYGVTQVRKEVYRNFLSPEHYETMPDYVPHVFARVKDSGEWKYVDFVKARQGDVFIADQPFVTDGEIEGGVRYLPNIDAWVKGQAQLQSHEQMDVLGNDVLRQKIDEILSILDERLSSEDPALELIHHNIFQYFAEFRSWNEPAAQEFFRAAINLLSAAALRTKKIDAGAIKGIENDPYLLSDRITALLTVFHGRPVKVIKNFTWDDSLPLVGVDLSLPGSLQFIRMRRKACHLIGFSTADLAPSPDAGPLYVRSGFVTLGKRPFFVIFNRPRPLDIATHGDVANYGDAPDAFVPAHLDRLVTIPIRARVISDDTFHLLNDKFLQAAFFKKYGIHAPKTVALATETSLAEIESMMDREFFHRGTGKLFVKKAIGRQTRGNQVFAHSQLREAAVSALQSMHEGQRVVVQQAINKKWFFRPLTYWDGTQLKIRIDVFVENLGWCELNDPRVRPQIGLRAVQAITRQTRPFMERVFSAVTAETGNNPLILTPDLMLDDKNQIAVLELNPGLSSLASDYYLRKKGLRSDIFTILEKLAAEKGQRHEMRTLPPAAVEQARALKLKLTDEGDLQYGDDFVPLDLGIDLWGVPHGVTNENVTGTMNGSRTDSSLNDEGHRQAEQSAEKLWEALGSRLVAGETMYFVTSPLLRARQTAQHFVDLAQRHGVIIQLIVIQGLRERDMGEECRGLKWKDLGQFPWAEVNRVGTKEARLKAYVKAPSGESELDYITFQKTVLTDLGRTYRGHTVVAFGHGFQIDAAKVLLKTPDTISPDRIKLPFIARDQPILLAHRPETRDAKTLLDELVTAIALEQRETLLAGFDDWYQANGEEAARYLLSKLEQFYPLQSYLDYLASVERANVNSHSFLAPLLARIYYRTCLNEAQAQKADEALKPILFGMHVAKNSSMLDFLFALSERVRKSTRKLVANAGKKDPFIETAKDYFDQYAVPGEHFRPGTIKKNLHTAENTPWTAAVESAVLLTLAESRYRTRNSIEYTKMPVEGRKQIDMLQRLLDQYFPVLAGRPFPLKLASSVLLTQTTSSYADAVANKIFIEVDRLDPEQFIRLVIHECFHLTYLNSDNLVYYDLEALDESIIEFLTLSLLEAANADGWNLKYKLGYPSHVESLRHVIFEFVLDGHFQPFLAAYQADDIRQLGQVISSSQSKLDDAKTLSVLQKKYKRAKNLLRDVRKLIAIAQKSTGSAADTYRQETRDLGKGLVKNYVTKEFGKEPVRLPDELVRAYFGAQVLQNSHHEGRSFFVRKLDPRKDLHFLEEWKAQIQSDGEWLQNWAAKGRSREIAKGRFPYFGFISAQALGIISQVEDKETLEGFVGFEALLHTFDAKRAQFASGINISQIEVYYRNVGRDGRIKGIPDLLLDILIVMATDPNLNVTGGIQLNPMTPGSKAFTKRRDFEAPRNQLRLLRQSQVHQEAQRVLETTPEIRKIVPLADKENKEKGVSPRKEDPSKDGRPELRKTAPEEIQQTDIPTPKPPKLVPAAVKSRAMAAAPSHILHLTQPVIAIVEQARIDTLSPESFKELLEIAGLNNGKLHLVIPDVLKGKYSARVAELRKAATVHYHFPQLANSEDIPVIGFSDTNKDKHITEFQSRLDEQDPGLAQHIKDSAFRLNRPGDFGVGIWYALKEIPPDAVRPDSSGFRGDRDGRYCALVTEELKNYTVFSTSA